MEEYNKEELTAEIGAAMLLNQIGIETNKTFTNSAAYIQSWLKVLKSDNKFIVSVAGRAEKKTCRFNFTFSNAQELPLHHPDIQYHGHN